MSEDTQTLATILALLQSGTDEKAKLLDEIVHFQQTRKEAHEAIIVMNRERDELNNHRKETQDRVNAEIGRLEAAKRAHDDAAVEAARRIALQSEQAKELSQLKSTLDAKDKELSKRESAVARKVDEAKELHVRAVTMKENYDAEHRESKERMNKIKELIG